MDSLIPNTSSVPTVSLSSLSSSSSSTVTSLSCTSHDDTAIPPFPSGSPSSSTAHRQSSNPHKLDEATLRKKQQRWARRDEKKAQSKEGIWNNCMYYLQPKQRYCNGTRLPNSLYCISHDPAVFRDTTVGTGPSLSSDEAVDGKLPTVSSSSIPATVGTKASSTSTSTRKRIRCPIDPSHDIYEDDIQRHQYRCQFRKQINLLKEQSYYTKYVNSGTCSWKDTDELTKFRQAVGILHTFHDEGTDVNIEETNDTTNEIDDSPNETKKDKDNVVNKINDIFRGGIIGGATFSPMDFDTLSRKITKPSVDTTTTTYTATTITTTNSNETTAIETVTKPHNKNKGYVRRLLTHSDINFYTLIMRIQEWLTTYLIPSSTIDWSNNLLSTKEATRLLDNVRNAGGNMGKYGTLRHELQQISIISNMIYYDVLPAYRNELDTKIDSLFLHPQRIATVERPLFIEYGAGTGQLSRTLQDLLHHTADILLIDRATIRSKADKLIKMNEKTNDDPMISLESTKNTASLLCKRIRVDIVHFDLEGIEEIWNHASWRSGSNNFSSTISSSSSASSSASSFASSVLPIISIGKHLCGGATDITLRSLVRTFASTNGKSQGADVAYLAGDTEQPSALQPSHSNSSSSADGSNEFSSFSTAYLHGIAIATCCHHMCTWESYVGKHYWRNVLRSTPTEFESIRILSGWAIIGKKPSFYTETANIADYAKNEETCFCCKQSLSNILEDIGNCSVPHLPSTLTSLYPELRSLNEPWVQQTITYYDRIAIGRACKRIIDEGRADFLRRAFCRYGAVVPLTPKGFTLAESYGGTTNSSEFVDTEAKNTVNNPNPYTRNPFYTLDVRLTHYCEPAVSPENCLLVAVARYAV